MTVRKTVGTVGTLAQGAVSTAVSVVKHPIGSTALAAGLVKGAAGAGIGIVRTTISGTSPTPDSDTSREEAPAAPLSPEAEAPEAEVSQPEVSETKAPEAVEDPRDDIPGPDLAHFEPPSIDDLPEPIVIEAEPTAVSAELSDLGEVFHTEPKASSRDSEHGGQAGDREEADGYVEEIPAEHQPH